MDPELLAAFHEEFAAGCAGLAAAADMASARRHLSQLGVMADALGLAPVQAALAALAETTALDALRAAASGLAGLAGLGLGLGLGLAEAAPAPPHPAPCRTLIVDDSATIRRLLRDILDTDAGFVLVGEAADGRAGLQALAALRPDLTLLDLEMPECDGMGFLAEWALTGPGEVVVVSSAAHPGSPAALEALRRGARAAVAKPSGALSPDLAQRSGGAILAAARAAIGAR